MNEELIHVKEYYKDEGENTDKVFREYTKNQNGYFHGEFKEYDPFGRLVKSESWVNGKAHGVCSYALFTADVPVHTSVYRKNNIVTLDNIYQPIFNAIEKLQASDTVATHLVLEIALSPNKDTVSINVVEEVK